VGRAIAYGDQRPPQLLFLPLVGRVAGPNLFGPVGWG
jgi:hypothetical protein